MIDTKQNKTKLILAKQKVNDRWNIVEKAVYSYLIVYNVIFFIHIYIFLSVVKHNNLRCDEWI